MTLLRRTAQLVEDLRTLKVLDENDSILFHLLPHGKVDLTIFWMLTDTNSIRINKDTLKYSLENEFGQNKITQLTSTPLSMSVIISD